MSRPGAPSPLIPQRGLGMTKDPIIQYPAHVIALTKSQLTTHNSAAAAILARCIAAQLFIMAMCNPHFVLKYMSAPDTATVASPPVPVPAREPSSSTLHPVFFTERLRRPPALLQAAHSAPNSPVTHGYMYQETRPDGNTPKL